MRIATMQSAVTINVLCAAGMCVYAWVSSNHSLRLVASAILCLALIAGFVARRYGPRLYGNSAADSQMREPMLVIWNAIGIGAIALLAALDGGGESPISFLFVIPPLFTALTFPFRLTLIICALDVAAFLAVALGSGDNAYYTGFVAFGLICTAGISASEARNQTRRREELAATADALRTSEGISRLQARQQQEVARFGQRALSGEDIAQLLREGLRVLTRVLDVDLARVIKVVPEEQALVVVASEPQQAGGEGEALAPGTGSQAGYTLATGTPVIVDDWNTEARFERSGPLARR